MPIVTRWRDPRPFQAAVWEEGKPETLADVAELVGQELVERDGTVEVQLDGGKAQPIQPGWGAYLQDGRVAVASPAVVMSWRDIDPHLSPRE